MPNFTVAVDLGGTNLRIAAITSEGQLLEKITLGTKIATGRDRVIDEMCDAVMRLSQKYKGSGKFIGTGIGVPGIVDIETGIMRKAANLPGWENYPARAEIERRLNMRVVLENDARAAALGEQWSGAARGFSNMAVLTLGTGIGGGVVLGGKIWRGMSGMASEFGHVTVEPEGHICGCGNRGCSEQYASASALMRMAREAIARGAAPLLAKAAASDPEFGAKTIYTLALQGDEPARRIFQTFGRYLAILLGSLINILNVEIFVIGGGVSSAWDAFAPTMFEELRSRSLVYAATAPIDPLRSPAVDREGSLLRESRTERKTIITRALLGSDAGLYGAARLSEVAS